MSQSYYYYNTLERNPRLRMRNLTPLIKAVKAENEKHPERTAYALWRFPLGELEYSVKYSKGEFTLSWTSDGRNLEQTIKVVERSSNLPELKGKAVYYFLDSSGQLCRDLWYIGNRFRSRSSFTHHYKTQLESRRDRIFRGYPYRKYGKVSYKGRITPYGKRVEKYEHKEGERVLYMCKRLGIDVEKCLE